jgi:hypothetical protein
MAIPDEIPPVFQRDVHFARDYARCWKIDFAGPHLFIAYLYRFGVLLCLLIWSLFLEIQHLERVLDNAVGDLQWRRGAKCVS